MKTSLSPWRMIKAGYFFFTGLMLLSVCASPPQGFQGGNAGVRVTADSDLAFPDYKSETMDFTPLSDQDAAIAIRLTNDILSKYPQSLIDKTCRRVALVERLKIGSMNALGTRWKDTIVAVYSKTRERRFEQTIHHELSSLFLVEFRDRFPVKEWINCNPTGFSYMGFSIVRSNPAYWDLDAPGIPNGFLCGYSMVSMEDDFNTIIENLFVPSPGFEKRIAASDKVRHKIHLAVQFYESIGINLSKF